MEEEHPLTHLHTLIKHIEDNTTWHNGYLTIESLEQEVDVFRILHAPFPGDTPSEWVQVFRIVWMYYLSTRGQRHWSVTHNVLRDVGLYWTDPENDNVLPEIKFRFEHAQEETPHELINDNDTHGSTDDASEEVFQYPPLLSANGSENVRYADTWNEKEGAGADQEEGDQQKVEGKADSDDDEDHVTAMDGMRRIKDDYLALALRSTDARRGAHDDELQDLGLALECPYLCKDHGTASVVCMRARYLNAHMRRVHDRPRGFRVVAIDIDNKQYKMAGGGTQELVFWKVVPKQ